MIAVDLVGQQFGRLTILRRAENDTRGQAKWTCRCICGQEKVIRGKDLRDGKTQSCGCLQRSIAKEWMAVLNRTPAMRERVAAARRTHGLTGTRGFRSWSSMHTRCLNPKHEAYPRYGGRGITVCERWLHSFENFLTDMGERPPGRSLDRIDPEGNYEPGNCRWSTPFEQTHNRRKCA